METPKNLSGEVTITKHAYNRARKRLSWRPETLERMAKRALRKGIKHDDADKILDQFFIKTYKNQYKANNVRIYGENVYIFKDRVLLTIFRAPNDVLKVL